MCCDETHFTHPFNQQKVYIMCEDVIRLLCKTNITALYCSTQKKQNQNVMKMYLAQQKSVDRINGLHYLHTSPNEIMAIQCQEPLYVELFAKILSRNELSFWL